MGTWKGWGAERNYPIDPKIQIQCDLNSKVCSEERKYTREGETQVRTEKKVKKRRRQVWVCLILII